MEAVSLVDVLVRVEPGYAAEITRPQPQWPDSMEVHISLGNQPGLWETLQGNRP